MLVQQRMCSFNSESCIFVLRWLTTHLKLTHILALEIYTFIVDIHLVGQIIIVFHQYGGF